MRKTSEILNLIGAAFLLSVFPKETCFAVTVCAATQTYSALEAVKEHSPTEITTQYAAGEDLEALLAEDKSHCELVISADEKLPILLVRAGKASASSMSVLVRAPLILWSADPTLLDNKASVVANKKLTSQCKTDTRRLCSIKNSFQKKFSHRISKRQNLPYRTRISGTVIGGKWQRTSRLSHPSADIGPIRTHAGIILANS